MKQVLKTIKLKQVSKEIDLERSLQKTLRGFQRTSIDQKN